MAALEDTSWPTPLREFTMSNDTIGTAAQKDVTPLETCASMVEPDHLTGPAPTQISWRKGW